jgi:membrane AbrB-like protein
MPAKYHPRSAFGRTMMTAAFGFVGAVAFLLADLPLPLMFGPMTACLLAALAGAPLRGTAEVGDAARAVLGVAVGASITPATIAQLPSMAMSVALVPLYIVVIGMVGVPFFQRLCRYDPATAWYASMPGGLQDMVLFGAEAGGNPRALSLIHASRVLILMVLAPIIVTWGFGATIDNPIGAPAADLPAFELALMAAAAFVGWRGGKRIGLFGAAVLGPLFVTGALSLAGLIHNRPPAEAMLAAQFFIGVRIGADYTGVTLAEVRRDIASGVAFVLVLAALAAIFSEIVVLAGLASPVEAFLAFAPGGQAEMAMLAIVVGADLGFVVVHHVVRVLVVITGAPMAAKIFGRGPAAPTKENRTADEEAP